MLGLDGFGSLLAAVLAALFISACDPSPESGVTGRAGLEAIHLDQLEPGVREQYESITEELQEALRSPTEKRVLADAYGKVGNWLEAHNLDGSERAYLEASALDPANPRWHYHLGRLYDRLGRTSSAQAAYERVLERKPDHVPTLISKARLAQLAGRADVARQFYERARALRPASAAALAGLGRLDLEAGNVEGAVERLEAALALQPEAGSVRYLLGRAYAASGDPRSRELLESGPSRKTGQRLVRIEDPWHESMLALRRNSATYVDAGIRARRRGDLRGAMRSFELGSRSAPNNPRPLLEWAASLRLVGDLAGAEEKLERVLELSPTDPRAHLEMGLVRAEQGSPSALEALEKAAQLDPESVAAWYSLGEELRRLGRLERALAAFDSAIELSPDLAVAHHGRATVLAAMGRVDEAIVDLDRAEIPEPGLSLRSALLARLLAAGADPQFEVLERAMSLLDTVARPTVHSAESRAIVLAAMGRFDAAAAWQRAALESLEHGPGRRCNASLVGLRLEKYVLRERLPTSIWEADESICQKAVKRPEGL